jgi:hypothetical protein
LIIFRNLSERSDRSRFYRLSFFLLSFLSQAAPQSTPPIVQLSPTPEGSVTLPNEPEKSTSVQPPSPICVILDDDSSPAPSVEKKIVRQTSEKKSNENEKISSKQNKRSRDSDKTQTKDKSNEHSEIKRKRLNDGILQEEENKMKSNLDLFFRKFKEDNIK